MGNQLSGTSGHTEEQCQLSDLKMNDIDIDKKEIDDGELEKQFWEDTKKRQNEIAQAIEKMEKNPTIETWLGVLSYNVYCDPSAFNALNNAVKNAEQIHNLFLELKKYGIAKNPRFSNEINGLLTLFQKQWRLLDKTLLQVEELSGKCNSCKWAIFRWKAEIAKYNECYNNPAGCQTSMNTSAKIDTDIIVGSMTKLSKWIENRNTVAKLLDDWRQFKEEVQSFQLQWDRVHDSIVKEIKSRCRSWWGRNGGIFERFLSSAAGVAIGCIFGDMLVAVAFAFMPIVGVLGVSVGAYLLGFKASKTMKKAETEMVEGIEKMMTRLKQMVTSAERIEALCGGLNHEMTKQAQNASLINEYKNDKIMWPLIESKLDEIQISIVKFEGNCKEIAKIIVETQQKIVNRF